jgi:hypothetical protein
MTSESGSGTDPDGRAIADSLRQLLDQQTQMLAQITTINKRFESHDRRLAHMEKAPTDEDSSIPPRGGNIGGSCSGGTATGAGDEAFSHRDSHREDYTSRPKANFPAYGGESDPLDLADKV